MEISAKTSTPLSSRKGGGPSPALTWLTGLLVFLALSFVAFNQSPRSDPFQPPSLFESFFKPREQNAFMRLPAISGKSNDIFAYPESDLVWLVGNNGLIMHSSDAGKSWHQQSISKSSPAQNSPFENDLSLPQSILGQQSSRLINLISPITSAHAATPPEQEKKQRLIEPQNNSPVLPPNNDQFDPFQYDQQLEEQPTQQEEPPAAQIPSESSDQPPDLQAVHFVTPNRGIAIGAGGTIISTDDGGTNWRTVTITSNEDLFALAFSDQKNGFAAGNNGALLKTTDGGSSWQRISSGVKTNLRNISLTGDNSALITGENGVAIVSRDAGLSWAPLPATKTSSLLDAALLDQGEVLAILSNGNIVKGSTTRADDQIVFSNPSEQLEAITMLSNRSGFAIGDNGLVLRTADGGNNWKHIDINSKAKLLAISMSDNKNGYINASRGTIFKTSDGGESWQAITNGFARALFDIAIINDNTALVVGGDGAILKTTNAGKSWQPKASDTHEPIINLTLSDKNTVLAVGENGLVLKSVDSGDSWQRKDSGTTQYLNGITTLPGNTHLIVGDAGTVLKSSDGAETWQNKNNNTFAGLMRVSSINTTTLLAVGDDGTVIKSTNAGESWLRQATGVDSNILFGIAFTDDSNGFVVGEKGSLIKTVDGGSNWQTVNSGRDEFLVGIDMLSRLDGLIVGDNGTILRTRDGGNSWQPITSNTQQMLINIAMYDANNGYAVGGGATILKTSDGGNSWTLPEYQRYPGYWYWFSCGFFALFALGIAQYKTEQQKAEIETVADMLASDRPIEPGDPDPLAFGAIARGLSRFMRNPKTEPPLTVAITGAWGTGKSSLMNLLYHDLKKNGFTPVWFNAWHHQKGEQLLASLYANIRAQAVPGLFKFTGMTPTGVIFRLNLFFRRSKKHWLLALFMTILFTTSLLYLYQHPISLSGFNLPALFQSLQESDDLMKLLVALLGGIPPVAALLRSLRAFGINPATLSTSAQGEKNTARGVDPGARHRLAAEFEEVSQSLVLGRMVIFIDDLDRCSKENVVDILESINFLSVSGDCYIILGMDKSWVKICITEQFREMAREKPRFAEEYLEKLINIEVPVPVMAAADSSKLLSPEIAAKDILSRWQKAKGWLSEKIHFYRSILILMLILITGSGAGFAFTAWYQNSAAEVPDKPLPIVATWDDIHISDIDVSSGKPSLSLIIGKVGTSKTNSNGLSTADPADKNWQLILKASDKSISQGLPIARLGDKSASAELLLRLKQPATKVIEAPDAASSQGGNQDNQKPGSTPGLRNTQIKTSWWSYPVSSLIVVLLLIGLAAFLMRRSGPIEKDSPKFRQVLNIWHPWITLNRQTPRAIKRYLNRVRYLAMRYREDIEADHQKGALLSRLMKKSQPVQSVQTGKVSIDESTLVALSAIFAVDESWVIDLEKFRMLGAGQLDTLLQDKYPEQLKHSSRAIVSEFSAPLEDALNEHRKAFGSAIFDDTDERRQFLHILAAAKMN